MIAEEDIEKVRSAADIVQVIGEVLPLKRAGRNFKTLCPFHSEKSPSFMVNPEKQIYHCFGCHEGGNVIRFLMKQEGIDFPEAVEKLARRYGISISRKQESEKENRVRSDKELYFKINQLVARRFYENLLDPERGKRARDYLEKRKIRPEVMREYLLGYALPNGQDLIGLFKGKNVPLDRAESLGLIRRREEGRGEGHYDFFRDRLIFPVIAADGKIIGFSGRSIDPEGEPKYLNSSESPVYRKGESFLGLFLSKNAIRQEDRVVLVEGNFDQMRLYQEGIREVVAPLGTALTERQIQGLSRYSRNFIVIFDGDDSGQKAQERALELLLSQGLFPRGVTLPPGEDPDSFLVRFGTESFRQKIDQAPPLLDLSIEQVWRKEGGGVVGQGRAIKRITHLLSLIPEEVEKNLYIQRVAEITQLPLGLIQGEVFKSAKKGRNFTRSTGEESGTKVPPVERMLIEILVSGRVDPVRFFEEIECRDFSSEMIGRLWEILKKDHQSYQRLDISRVLNSEITDVERNFLSAVAVQANRWQEEEIVVVDECVKRFHVGRFRGILKGISHEIREAERERNLKLVQELLEKKTQILKQLNTIH